MPKEPRYSIKMVDQSFIRKKLVAENIRKRLEALGMQQNELADKIGMTPQQLSAYVLGKKEPREKTLKRIAEGLQLKSPMELYLMSSDFLGEKLAMAWNCLIEVDKLPEKDKLDLVIQFLTLILRTYRDHASPDFIKTIEHLIRTSQASGESH